MSRSEQGSWLVRNANLVDGTGAPGRPDHSILVSGATIAWVGPTSQEPEASIERVVDAQGRSLLPGLVNSHVHVCNDGAPDLFAQVRDDSIPVAAMRGARSARSALHSGITTVRDCGAANGVALELAAAIESGLIDGARLRAAGRVITMTGGHGYFMGRQADGVDAVRHAVRTELHGGAHFIKAMATGGVLTPGVIPTQTALLLEELTAIVQEAHNAGKRVATHAIGREGIRNALLAGVDSIEHGFYLDEELFELAVAQGTFLVPTLLAIDGIANEGERGGAPGWMVDKAQLEVERSREMFKAAVGSGMKIAAGTDAGTPFNPHDAMDRELALMVDIGLSPIQAIVSATRDAAENLDLHDRIGTLESGKLADLILVDGDPLADITVLSRVQLVAKEGVISRDEISNASTRGRSPQAAERRTDLVTT